MNLRTPIASRAHMIRAVSGFTIIELMVVIVLLAIIASIAFPSFTDLRDRNRIRAATEAVLFHLQFTRSESIKENRDLYLRVQEGSDWCVGIGNAPPASPACDCTIAESCRFGPPAALMEQNLLSENFPDITLETTHENISFDSRRGSLPDIPSGGTITLTGASDKYVTEIRFNITGRPLVCGNLGGYPSC